MKNAHALAEAAETHAHAALGALSVVLALATLGCAPRTLDAPGTVFIQPSIEGAGATLRFDAECMADTAVDAEDPSRTPRCYASWRVELEGLAHAATRFTPTAGEPPGPRAFAIQGGRPGDTTERVVTVLLERANGEVVTAARVAFILPWKGVKAVPVDVPATCAAIVPGTDGTCDISKLPAPFIDVTALADAAP